MPLPETLGRINRVATNRLVRRVAGRLPWFAVVAHSGRSSGRRYRTPVMAFRAPDGFVIALTYGPDTDWVRNVLAAGGANLEHRGRQIPVTDPRLARGDTVRQHVPAPIRAILRLLRVEDFLVLRESASS